MNPFIEIKGLCVCVRRTKEREMEPDRVDDPAGAALDTGPRAQRETLLQRTGSRGIQARNFRREEVLRLQRGNLHPLLPVHAEPDQDTSKGIRGLRRVALPGPGLCHTAGLRGLRERAGPGRVLPGRHAAGAVESGGAGEVQAVHQALVSATIPSVQPRRGFVGWFEQRVEFGREATQGEGGFSGQSCQDG